MNGFVPHRPEREIKKINPRRKFYANILLIFSVVLLVSGFFFLKYSFLVFFPGAFVFLVGGLLRMPPLPEDSWPPPPPQGPIFFFRDGRR